MGDFVKLRPAQLPPSALARTPENRYWEKFKRSATVEHPLGVTNVDFSLVAPFDIVATTGARLEVYSAQQGQAKRAIARFKDTAYSGSFRDDGKMLIAGGEECVVRVFDAVSRGVLRTMRGHEKAVHRVRFCSDHSRAISASDDASVRIWDVPTGETLGTCEGHTDYVRSLCRNPSVPLMWATGGYDHCVRIWDERTLQTTMKLDHSDPVEDVIIFPQGGICVSAAGPAFHVWDLLSGGRLVLSVTHHHKTVTCLAFDSETQRLMTGSLDGQLKIYSATTFSVTHSLSFPSPILCAGVSSDSTVLAVGMADGLLQIKHRAVGTESTHSTVHEPFPGTRAFFQRGKNARQDKGDFTAPTERRVRLKEYDRFLKKFRYHDALDAVLKTGNPALVISLVLELKARGGLRAAVGGREDEALIPLLNFLAKNVTNPDYAEQLVSVTDRVVDIYGDVMHQSDAVVGALSRLQSRLAQELKMERSLFPTLGVVELILGGSVVTNGSNFGGTDDRPET